MKSSRAQAYLRGIGALGLACALAVPTIAVPAQLTPSQPSGIGVWYQPHAPRTEQLWRSGDAGERLILRGRVLSRGGSPLGGAAIEVWHADAAGVVHPDRFRATLESAADGGFRVSTVLPGYIWGPRHVHVVISHPRHARFVTRLFFRRDPELALSDHPGVAVFLEDGRLDGTDVLFGRVDLVLP